MCNDFTDFSFIRMKQQSWDIVLFITIGIVSYMLELLQKRNCPFKVLKNETVLIMLIVTDFIKNHIFCTELLVSKSLGGGGLVGWLVGWMVIKKRLTSVAILQSYMCFNYALKLYVIARVPVTVTL